MLPSLVSTVPRRCPFGIRSEVHNAAPDSERLDMRLGHCDRGSERGGDTGSEDGGLDNIRFAVVVYFEEVVERLRERAGGVGRQRGDDCGAGHVREKRNDLVRLEGGGYGRRDEYDVCAQGRGGVGVV